MSTRTICIINEKKHFIENDIKDFTNIDLESINCTKLPEYAKHDSKWIMSNFGWDDGSDEERRRIYLDVKCIEKDAFEDLKNLECFHICLIFKQIEKIDLKNMEQLRELCLETDIDEDDEDHEECLTHSIDGLPKSLEKLCVISFNIEINSLFFLENLTTLELFNINKILIMDTAPFHGLKKLKKLSVAYSRIVFDKAFVGKPMIQIGPESLKEIFLTVWDELDPIFYFENLPYLSKFVFFSGSPFFNFIDIPSFKKVTSLEFVNFTFYTLTKEEAKKIKKIFENSTKIKRFNLEVRRF